MKTKELFDLLQINDSMYLSQAIEKKNFGPIEDRNIFYQELLRLNNYDVSKDWFQNVYEEELAQRKQSKQDFTPNTVGVILSRLTGFESAKIYEPTAGNGGLLISNYWHRCLNSSFPIMFFPSQHEFECWELSDRSIPILLLNLSIRGMQGVVYHGDVLEQTIKAKYILLNRNDDALAFSEIIHDKNLNLKIIEL